MKLIITTEPSRSYEYQEVTFMRLIKILIRAMLKKAFAPHVKCHYCASIDCHSVGGDTYQCCDCGMRFDEGEI